MLASIIHILPLVRIRRERKLPAPGKVTVRKGQKVIPTDVVAEANLFPEHQWLDAARGLGLRAAQADEQIQVKIGSQVSEGDVIAGPVGLARRLVRAPADGRVVMVSGGRVLLEVQTTPFSLKAGLSGEVSDLISDLGAVIETTGALIQGTWGNGSIDYGLMNVLIASPEEDLAPDRLDVSLRGSIVLGGHCSEADVLRTAEELPLRGLILGSLNPTLIPLATQMKIPVVVLEGFGRRPMNSAAFRLLTSNERREVALNAEPWDRYTGARPEIVIPLPASGELPLPRDVNVFTPGQQVRVVRAPYAGEIGTLVSLQGAATFPSGIRAQAAAVRLEIGDVLTLPLANLEILE